jgi:hypothetical protein
MNAITKEEFLAFHPFTPDRMSGEWEERARRIGATFDIGLVIGRNEEREWFQHGIMIGVVVFDTVDEDWGFVALGPDERGRYRGFDLDASFLTADFARSALEEVFHKNETETVFPQGD